MEFANRKLFYYKLSVLKLLLLFSVQPSNEFFFHDSQGSTFVIFRDRIRHKRLFLSYAFALIFLDLDKLSWMDSSFLRRVKLVTDHS